VRLAARDTARAAQLAAQTQCTLTVRRTGGGARLRRLLLRRLLPLLLAVISVACLAWSTLFLWEIRVTGNKTVPTARIRNALRACGVDYGSYWPDFTSDQLRSRLLLELPELAWATVNVRGSIAEVIVRERVARPALFDEDAPTDVVAAKTGFLTKLQVLRGAAAVQRGSAVTAGETLISGAVGSRYGGTYLVHAAGIAEAQTYYSLTAEMPEETLRKTYTGEAHTRWALLIGNSRCNFFGNSSFSDKTCDKIKTEWALAVPGLFRLPVRLVRETQRAYTLSARQTDAAAAVGQMQRELWDTLQRSIGEQGSVLSRHWTHAAADGRIIVCLRATCSEPIAAEAPHTQERNRQSEEDQQ
jgi:similar to stage IV sporulation protein